MSNMTWFGQPILIGGRVEAEDIPTDLNKAYTTGLYQTDGGLVPKQGNFYGSDDLGKLVPTLDVPQGKASSPVFLVLAGAVILFVLYGVIR